MKLKTGVTFLLALALILPTVSISQDSISAEEITVGESTVIDTSDFVFNENSLTITNYIGDDLEVVIPSEIEGKKVRVISEKAFNLNKFIKKVTIPNTVITIENAKYVSLGDSGAFSGCSALKEVIFEEGSNVTAIGDRAFENCVSLASINLPEGVATIGYNAFQNCKSLETITIPSSVTSIGETAFQDCDSLKSITIPSSVTSIGERAFGYSGYDKIEDFVIYGDEGSVAEAYAIENGFYFNDMPVEVTTVKGDLNGDGAVNSADLLKLKKYLLGLIDTLD